MSGSGAFERLLAKVMGWSTADIEAEYYHLAVLGNSGYDDYMQFMPGMRFVANLVMWLRQFPESDRQTAYKFVKDKVLFIGRAQMEQIVSTAYPNYVLPTLVKQFADEQNSGFRFWEPEKILESKGFGALRDQCLFMGMSDGAHMDEFRRSDSQISHEQVARTHEISAARASKMLKELKKTDPGAGEPKFRNVFLMDDFSASGTSYISRSDSGKISAFHKSITSADDPLSGLVDCSDLRVHVILYVATANAVETIRERGKRLFGDMPFSADAIHTLPDSVKFDESEYPEFAELAQNPRFGHEDMYDKHCTPENTKRPWLGFADCGLPLILYHNTPNNSMPILHRNDERTEFRGLFPRIARHK